MLNLTRSSGSRVSKHRGPQYSHWQVAACTGADSEFRARTSITSACGAWLSADSSASGAAHGLGQTQTAWVFFAGLRCFGWCQSRGLAPVQGKPQNLKTGCLVSWHPMGIPAVFVIGRMVALPGIAAVDLGTNTAYVSLIIQAIWWLNTVQQLLVFQLSLIHI